MFLLVPLLWGAYRGFKKGLIIEVFSLVALVLGVVCAVYFPGHAQELIKTNFQVEAKWMPVTAFVVTFIAVVIGVNLLGKLIEKMVDVLALSFVNKLTGLGFGVLKVAVILSVALFLFEGVNRKWELLGKEKTDRSLLYNPLVKVSSAILPSITDRKWMEDFSAEKKTLSGQVKL